MAGISTVRLGAPLAKGTPLVTEAQAYSIDGAIAGWLAFMASTNFSGVACTSSCFRKISVDPHQQVTSRATRFVFRKFAMSSLICSASSYLFFPFLTLGPSSFFTYSGSNAAFIGFMPERNVLAFSRSCKLSTPALEADWKALSLKMSHPPNTKSSSSPSGTNFLIGGVRPSVRFPKRIVPSCVSDPTGADFPLRTSSTPAMNVVLTAPMPGSSTPNFPFAGAIFAGFSMLLLKKIDMKTTVTPTDAARHYKQTSNDARTSDDLKT